MNPHLDKLHNLRQGHLSVQDYIVIFKDLTRRSEVREHHSETITRFIWGLRPKLRRALITGSYDLDIVEEAFDVVLNVDLTFKTIVNAKARCSKFKRYEHHDYQCSSESQHIRTVPIDDVDDPKVVENVQVLYKTISIIEYITVGFDTVIIDEARMSSDSASNDVNVKVEPNTTTIPSKPVESLVLDIVL